MTYLLSLKDFRQFTVFAVLLIKLFTNRSVKALKINSDFIEQDIKCDSDGPIVYSGNKLIFSRNDTYEVVQGSDIHVKCRSQSPVELRYSGFVPNPPQSTLSTINRLDGIPCYEVSVNLTSKNIGAGRYECVNYATRVRKSALIFVNINSAPYRFYSDIRGTFQGIIKENQIILPCVSLRPTVQMKLIKDGNEMSLQENVHYDPSQGFLFNITELENPFGTYQCVGVGEDNYNISIFLNSPTAWNEIGFEYDEKEFRCLNADEMILVPCNTPRECNFVRSCGSPTWAFSESCKTLQQGLINPSRSIDNIMVIKREENDRSKYTGGLILCSDNQYNTQEFSFFSDLNGQLVLDPAESVLKNGKFMAMSSSVEFEWDEIDRTWVIFSLEKFSVECKVSTLLFTDAIQWRYQLKNGSFIDPHVISEITTNKYNYVSKTSVFSIEDTQVENILCTAGRIDTMEWDNITHSIKIIESALKLEGMNETVTVELNNGNSNLIKLSCNATGIPIPTFTWYKNGKEITDYSNRSTNINNHMVSSSITLNITRASDEYTCNATNFRETQLRHITVNSTIMAKSQALGRDWAAGVLVILLVFSTSYIVYILLKKRATLEDFTKEDIEEFMKGNNSTTEGDTDSTDYWAYERLPYLQSTEIENADTNLVIEEELGQGNFGVVHKGKLNIDGVEKTVAVKTPLPNPSKKTFKDFLAELKVMQHVGEHDNVVKFIGSVTKDIAQKKAFIVVEICELNDLKNFMLTQRTTFQCELKRPSTPSIMACHYSQAPPIQPAGYSETGVGLRTSHLIQWSYEIAAGMDFLSSKKIVHRDLAARNILLNSQLVTKITDFGLSRNLYDSNYYAVPSGQRRELPMRWLSIEARKFMKFSVESDIWAFGIVMFEIFTLGDDPMEGVPVEYILPFLEEGSRMEKPRFANQAIYNIMLKCWDEDGSKRPRFRQLKEEIDDTRNTLGQLNEESEKIRNNIEVRHFDSDIEYSENGDDENDNWIKLNYV